MTAPVSRLIDTTLREGLQTPGVYLSLERKIEILAGLATAGVGEIEIGIASGGGPGLRPEVAELAATGLQITRALPGGVRLAVWCRARAADLEAAAALDVDVVSVCLPVSGVHLRSRLRRPAGWAVDQVGALAGLARRVGIRRLSLGLEDVTRADPALVARVLRAASTAGVDRVRLADTLGLATPLAVAALVTRCRRLFEGEVAVHAHNDLGMATANAVTALACGATGVDVSLLGLGERAGIARLEEVAACLLTAAGGGAGADPDAGDLARITRLSRALAEWTGRPPGPDRPLLGEDIFVCESGLHVDGLLKDPRSYQPYPPEMVGRRQEVRIGQHAGRGAVAAVLRRHGALPVTDDRIAGTTAAVRSRARLLGRPLTDDEVLSLAGSAPLAGGVPAPATGGLS
ncbi:MAG: homocitrate synthase NifV [Actinomycetota bacterium]|nr:homocitrate synthase NifV [Actinomycetota bacterium]